ncbi:kinetochore Sim4 complex subunit FTA2-domain-containing protein [Phialemonium atrogriseum]|uniref:Kinetochore Sim4 complex subunit FTA2-domain-containing protein n=1 Tax=Phialemonium atrogriseum TaxID=1093897 RepID=A0AAJ0C9P1_9PEZI|nr:kinetochore Sim4 complex subunit FTA2-domain-containing protein [Phialemonium atrogriseum]KAK1771498.1 kinetochore Sim4 complex subunit FTA2-domain-containing protein [Phialemonium atrogriseum]
MFPTYVTPDKLLPMPTVEGPKLQPFDFGGKEDIDFLDPIMIDEEGALTSFVVQASIGGRVYALKLFKFHPFYHWGQWPYGRPIPDGEELYDHWEFFINECRAYGRLKEAGREDLAAKCHGYFFLKEEDEKVLEDKYGLDPSAWDIDDARKDASSKDGQYRPIRVLVKDFVPGDIDFHPRQIPRMLQDLISIQNLGLVVGDMKRDAYVNGVLVDFSHSMTTPHPAITPGMAPGICDRLVAEQAFHNSRGDFQEFDWIIDYWNNNDGLKRGFIWHRALANYRYVGKIRSKDPAKKIPRAHKLDGLVSRCNPRVYDWKASGSVGGVRKPRRCTRWVFWSEQFSDLVVSPPPPPPNP